MSYSNQNPAWDRMMKGRYDAMLQAETRLAQQLMDREPGWSRSEALRRAAIIIAKASA